MLRSNVYKKSPVILQNILLTLRGLVYISLRNGKTFKRMFSELESTQYFDMPRIRDWQRKRLHSIVRHVYENVPYYKRIFRKLGLMPEDIKEVEDLKKLPILTKEDVRKNLNDLVAKNINRFFVNRSFTTGTSGKALTLYRDLNSINFENAILWRQRRWAGIDFSDRIAVLREEQIVPFYLQSPPFWRYSYFENKLYISAYHLSKENSYYYAEILQDFQPHAIEAEPSSLYILSRLIKDAGISVSLPSLKAILTSSEILLDRKKELIEEVFGAPIYDYYGNAERVIFIGMCERGNYHILQDYGITELLPLDGEAHKKELIGTALCNYAMPLLRYRIGDVVKVSDSPPCACGRLSQTVERIEGRYADFLISMKNQIIYVDVCYIFLQGVEGLVESQIIQEEKDRIRVKYTPGRDFRRKDRERIIKNIKLYMGDETKVILEETDSFYKDRSSKYRPFISYIGRELGL